MSEKRLSDICKHVDLPKFKEPYSDEKLKGLSAAEVRRRWPRRVCPDCGTIIYESQFHYYAGDY